MSHRPTACRCFDDCRFCRGARDAEAVKLHNERVACHGERSYPGDREIPKPVDWLEELLRG